LEFRHRVRIVAKLAHDSLADRSVSSWPFRKFARDVVERRTPSLHNFGDQLDAMLVGFSGPCRVCETPNQWSHAQAALDDGLGHAPGPLDPNERLRRPPCITGDEHVHLVRRRVGAITVRTQPDQAGDESVGPAVFQRRDRTLKLRRIAVVQEIYPGEHTLPRPAGSTARGEGAVGDLRLS
jgi:hypothetical protein